VRDLRDEAVVLRGYKSGEADRVVVLWTKEHGKLRCIAKGVRKSGSRIGGGLEPLAHVQAFLGEGRGQLLIVRQIHHLKTRNVIRADYDRLTAALAVIEAADAIPAEDVADPDLFDLLVRALDTLDDPQFRPQLVPAGFFLRLLAHDGSEPVVTECVNCGSLGPLVSFDAMVGGALCANCRSGRPISQSALDLLRRILGGDLAGVLRQEDPPAAEEVVTLTQEAIERHFGKRLKVNRTAALGQ
jgi:DNA repair protein RecO (recombination protein O)